MNAEDQEVAAGLAAVLAEVERGEETDDRSVWFSAWEHGLELFAEDGTSVELERAAKFADQAVSVFRQRFPRAGVADVRTCLESRVREERVQSEAFAAAEAAEVDPASVGVCTPSRHLAFDPTTGVCITCGARIAGGDSHVNGTTPAP